MRSLQFLSALAFCLLIASVSFGQSKAKAPPLDDDLRAFIRSMTTMTDTPLPVFDGKAVVVGFFASWCPPCKPEFAEMDKLRARYTDDDVAIVSINLFEGFFKDDGGVRLRRFLKRSKPTFAVLRGPEDAEIEAAFGDLDRIPTVYVYDRMGRPIYTFIHQPNATKMHVKAAEIIPHLDAALATQ